MTSPRLRVVRVVRVGSAKPFRNLYRYLLKFYFLGLRKGTRTTRKPISNQSGPFRRPRSHPI
jgi:hypothetical protein